MTGYIKRILKEKNFGFIDGGKREFFFHRDDFVGVWDDLVADVEAGGESVLVEFEEAESRKGPRASDVRRV
mgnify:CR=1 FL=1